MAHAQGSLSQDTGWRGSEATARRKFVGRAGEYGGMPNARVPLTDEEVGEALTIWPEEERGSAMLARMIEETPQQEDQAGETEDGLEDVYGEAPPVDDYVPSTRPGTAGGRP
ncbi:hypothetical protein ACGFYV_26240 [Streptomyces sp. NPDC048297]|uniref:hypothetical protein n=1 Tax=Streptomyces sp. NPDC048297 TaxID=3365531 RepID=UPI0037228067